MEERKKRRVKEEAKCKAEGRTPPMKTIQECMDEKGITGEALRDALTKLGVDPTKPLCPWMEEIDAKMATGRKTRTQSSVDAQAGGDATEDRSGSSRVSKRAIAKPFKPNPPPVVQ